jgi:hypothetical protein
VVSLLPADQPKKSSGSRRKQTIDLRSGTSLPEESSNARSTNRAPILFVGETERKQPQADNWVDLAIPEKYFEDSQISSPTCASSGSQPAIQSSPPTKPERQTPASPTPFGSVQSPSSVSAQPPSTFQERQDNPAAVSTAGETPGSSRQGKGQTFEPDQAIPDWLWPDGDRNTATTADDSASTTQPANPSSQPGRASPANPPIDQPLEAVPSILIDPPSTDRVSPEQPRTQSQHSVAGTQQTATETQVPQASPQNGATTAAGPPNHTPVFSPIEHHPALIDAATSKVEYSSSDFSPENGPQGSTFDPNAAAAIYRGKFAVPVQRPWIELWRPLYTSGIYPPAPLWFGATNPMKPHFMVYGDFRSAVGFNRNQLGKSNVWGNVLNLDMDLQLTSTERIHAFVSPLNRAAQATGLAFNDDVDVLDQTNFNFNTLFFEGDVGALLGGATGKFPRFDLPFTFGLIPLVYQNGIWANDAVLGAAVALPARHSRALKWSNFDATLFWATDNITTDAFPNQDSAADLFGTAWFIDAYEGYIEADYAFVNDNTGAGLGYHNLSFGFTRRYLARLSNSIRYVVNLGQDELDKQDRTADGHLVLLENSLITAYPNTVVPYLNLFYGQGRPQSLARAGVAGGILNNTGINFETDGITGYPTLDATAHNTWGLASGINLLGSQFAHQLILEMAMVMAMGPQQLRNAEGDQYAVGMRYQKPLNHFLIFRTDHMMGFREGADELHGSRFELRWKF